MNIGAIQTLIDSCNAKAQEEFGEVGGQPYVSIDVHGGVSHEEVQELSRDLGISFCNDYAQFLMEFGSIYSKMGELFHGAVPKKYRYDGEGPGDYFLEMNKKFFNEVYKGPAFRAATLFHATDDGEYYAILNHDESVVTGYDIFKESLCTELSGSIEDYMAYFIRP